MNQKGQVFIESLILLSLCTLCSVKLIQLGLHLISEIVVEDLLEQTLICKLQKQPLCIHKLRNKLIYLNFTSVQITDHSYLNTARITIQWQTNMNYRATLESELALDLSVP